MFKADFHTHTNYTLKDDSVISPKTLINLAAAKNYKVLAITEHASRRKWNNKVVYHKNPLRTYFDFKDYARKKGILLLPGVETIIEGKEVLLINFKGDAKKVQTFESAEKLKDENVLLIAPHPFFGRASCLKEKLIENINIFDAIEHSHFYTRFINLNKKAVEVAKKYNKTLVANSDAHYISQFNINYTLVNAEQSVDSVLEAIRKGKVKIQTRPLSLYQFLKIGSWAIFSSILKRLS